ncbi:DUF1294 domain-containing protein [Paenibacillus koleovorans]|uniref:DUF1294 domain-containing protein n=1 Tax=Paenibacillus koleovorans TaxID=121608 RepID=UPI000FDA6C33|nr:DUF1294 domain-containing protein [Paenibacillus koleovorans]
MKLLVFYLIVLNFAGYAVMGYDKQQAKRKNRRIPEKRLFLIALAGGAAGVLIGMQLWRHKTKHLSFTVGIPLLLALNIGCLYAIYTQI